MYEIKKYQDQYEMYEVIDPTCLASFQVCPERGGIITEFQVDGADIFYLDKETLYDPNANVRGGNPILFPICGQLEHAEYEWNGTVYSMKNHGVARTNPWQVVSTDSEKGQITLRLTSDEQTRRTFPFDFELLFTYSLREGALVIDQEYRNLSDVEMPMYAGFHPYFATQHKQLRYGSDATQYLDYNDMRIKPFEGLFNLQGMVESAVLLDPKQNKITFELPELGKTIEMEYGPEFKYVVLWSVEDKDFICVEPWMAKTGELNRKEELPFVKAGEALKTSLTIRVK